VADTTLRVGAGEFVSVVGPTGCGKSTLLNIGRGLLAASSGDVKVFGQALAGNQPPRRLHVPDRGPDALAQRQSTT
jgi:ABC-type nitrate/sulfonate/bicarbonate transport system ATPase subunit